MTRPRRGKHKAGGDEVAHVRLDGRQQRVLVHFAWPEKERDSVDPKLREELVRSVEANLTFAGIAATNEAGPREAGQRLAVLEVLQMARTLQRAIKELPSSAWEELDREFDYYNADPLNIEGGDRHLVAVLAELQRSAQTVADSLRAIESRGRRPTTRRNILLNLMVGAFRDVTDVSAAKYRGAAIDFARETLKMAGLTAPDSDEKLWTLVRKELRLPKSAESG